MAGLAASVLDDGKTPTDDAFASEAAYPTVSSAIIVAPPTLVTFDDAMFADEKMELDDASKGSDVDADVKSLPSERADIDAESDVLATAGGTELLVVDC